MKARTKLTYNYNKYEDFDYGMCNWYTKHNRSYSMVVTADTEEECQELMSSFEKYICKEKIQYSFEGNEEPTIENNKWVGSVEIYISNDDVAFEKELIKQVYKEWKESIKNITVKSKEEVTMINKEIKIDNIVETTFDDGTYWIEYNFDGKLGYELTDEYQEDDKEMIQEWIDNEKFDTSMFTKKINIEKCSVYLAEIIENCRQSENEMWFVEQEDLDEKIDRSLQEDFLKKIYSEVYELGIQDYIEFNNDDCLITVFGGVITKFLF